jgi:hypothetical protein
VNDQILGQKMWPVFSTTKNSFFSYIYAANASSPDPAVATGAKTQLAQFPPPPRVLKAVDLRNDPRYVPHDPNCADQTSHTSAVDVGERPVGDFLWQRAPWGLYDPGDPAQAEPGVDYLVAYWMGRAHALLDDDTPSSCMRWK